MVNKADKNVARLRRHRRVRGKISGTAARPRLDVFRSAKHIYAQVIDDEQGVTLASASSMDKDFNAYGGNIDAAKKVGENIAKKCLEKGIEAPMSTRQSRTTPRSLGRSLPTPEPADTESQLREFSESIGHMMQENRSLGGAHLDV